MHRPRHPGATVRNIIEEMGWTVTEAAKRLGVARWMLNDLVNRKSGASPEMALRLEAVLGSTAEDWLRMQMNHDLAALRKRQSEITNGLRRAEPA